MVVSVDRRKTAKRATRRGGMEAAFRSLNNAAMAPYRQLHKLRGYRSRGDEENRSYQDNKRDLEYERQKKENFDKSIKKKDELGYVIPVKIGSELNTTDNYAEINSSGEFKELGKFEKAKSLYNPKPEDYGWKYNLEFEKGVVFITTHDSTINTANLKKYNIFKLSEKELLNNSIRKHETLTGRPYEEGTVRGNVLGNEPLKEEVFGYLGGKSKRKSLKNKRKSKRRKSMKKRQRKTKRKGRR